RDVQKVERADVVERDGGLASGDRREQSVIGREARGLLKFRLRVCQAEEEMRAREVVVAGALRPGRLFGGCLPILDERVRVFRFKVEQRSGGEEACKRRGRLLREGPPQRCRENRQRRETEE